ncbi:MAG: DUF2079 domain-containing protein [Candidatus Omnitrophica bacterium]|nr:DUF2079 domain-containing protein [Candidatus Omnitrophota bacterium]
MRDQDLEKFVLPFFVFVLMFWAVTLTVKYFCFGYYDWDLAIYNQAMWGLSRGTMTPSIWGINFFSNHAEYISFLLLPFYFIAQHPLTLIYLKVLAHVLAGYVLFRMAVERLGLRPAFVLAEDAGCKTLGCLDGGRSDER